jgi:hypothetical protein
MRSFSWLLVLLIGGIAPVVAEGPKSRSEDLAHQLTALAVRQHLGAVAAKDPNAPDRFVAALVFPDVQLLVVSARYGTPSIIEDQLAKKAYSDVYAALNQVADKSTLIFVHDLKADGLHVKSEGSVDILYEGVAAKTVFGGGPGGQKLSDDAYEAKFATADSLYCHMLTALIDQIKGITATP